MSVCKHLYGAGACPDCEYAEGFKNGFSLAKEMAARKLEFRVGRDIFGLDDECREILKHQPEVGCRMLFKAFADIIRAIKMPKGK